MSERTSEGLTFFSQMFFQSFSAHRYVCDPAGRRCGRCGHLGLRHTDGCGESPDPDVRCWRTHVRRSPALHESERERRGSEGFLQRAPAQQPQSVSCQCRDLPQLRESDEDLLSASNMTSRLTSSGYTASPYERRKSVRCLGWLVRGQSVRMKNILLFQILNVKRKKKLERH